MASFLVLAACSPGGDDDDAVTGALAVDVIGLPDGVDADITITGPEGAEGEALVEQTVTESGTLTNLAPGEYTVAADAVMEAETTHAPTETEQTITVSAGDTVEVTVAYEAIEDAATLNVVIEGDLPEGADAAVTVTGPDAFERTLTEADTLVVAPGTYTVSAEDATVGETLYDATVDPADPVTLAADEEATVTVTYTEMTVVPEAGAPDLDFGEDGTGTYVVDGAASSVHDIETFADDTVLLAGVAIDDGDTTESVVLVRGSADGAVDTSFGTDGYALLETTGTIQALDARVVADEIVVAAVVEDADALFMVLSTTDLDGTLVGTPASTAFDGDAATFDAVTDVDVLADGAVVVAGYGNDNPDDGDGVLGEGEDADTDLGIALFDADGLLDTEFGASNGVYFADQGGQDLAHGVLALNDGSFVLFGEASGSFTAVHVSDGGALVDDFYSGETMLVDENDPATPDDPSDDTLVTIDNRFDHDFGGLSAAYDAAETAEGDIILGGTAGGDFALVSLTEVADADPLEDGAQAGYVLDEDFGTEGEVTTDFASNADAITALTVADGMLYAAGTSEVATDDADMVLARYSVDGTPDAEFGDAGLVTADFGGASATANALGLTDDHVLVGGEADGDAALAAFFR